ncbi:predicted protein [Streptomyces viridosporus ATCC 14672]|uniref:Predicted protein n=1 Tax=Streptomyces viridosporus (strain ATCC 14672 / DSM 40746 / JCM 4963 / KCTC 9882 / NRRL B-12104 / FH 1290) TaxID=566461 RepID=D6AA80_STRV1|nr:predicted protein [Streptomyces viridosporus ATCC 14672]
MRAVVAGSADFVGSHPRERLLARAQGTVCVDGLVTGLPEAGVPRPVDLGDPEKVTPCRPAGLPRRSAGRPAR